MHVPEGWSKKKINDIAKTVTSGSRNWAQYYADQGSKFIRMTNLNRDGINLLLDELQYVNITKNTTDGKRTALKDGDILISITAELGKIGWIPKNFGEAYINQHIALIRLNKNLSNSKYIAYLLSSSCQNRIINRLNDSGAKAGLNLPTVRSIPILLPPLAEQEKIAEILSTWDHAIEQTERLKANAETHKQALMQQLLTGKKRFPEFEGEWEEVKIGSFIKESRVPSIDNSPTNRLTVRLHLKGVEAREVRGTEAVNSTGHYIRRAGQFIYGRQNFHNGAIGIIPEELDFFESSQDIPCFDFKNHCVSSWFFHFCSQESFYKRMEHYTTGTGSKRLHPNDFMKIKIKLPSLEEQQKIAAVLNRADREIELLAQKLDHLKTENAP